MMLFNLLIDVSRILLSGEIVHTTLGKEPFYGLLNLSPGVSVRATFKLPATMLITMT